MGLKFQMNIQINMCDGDTQNFFIARVVSCKKKMESAGDTHALGS